jgi:hypothetical protein
MPPGPKTANINRDRLFACCGEDGPAPSGAALQSCITDVDGFIQDKNSLGTACSASQLPQGGPGLTQKVRGSATRPRSMHACQMHGSYCAQRPIASRSQLCPSSNPCPNQTLV